MFIKIRLSKIHNRKRLRQRIILFLVCILITLQYLHGEHYAQCDCIFPDEILDIPCYISPLYANEENNISFENIGLRHFNTSFKIRISSIYNNGLSKNLFLLEWLPINCFKKRLFQLQHFNS
jgi:hypothetical protein